MKEAEALRPLLILLLRGTLPSVAAARRSFYLGRLFLLRRSCLRLRSRFL